MSPEPGAACFGFKNADGEHNRTLWLCVPPAKTNAPIDSTRYCRYYSCTGRPSAPVSSVLCSWCCDEACEASSESFAAVGPEAQYPSRCKSGKSLRALGTERPCNFAPRLLYVMAADNLKRTSCRNALHCLWMRIGAAPHMFRCGLCPKTLQRFCRTHSSLRIS